MKTVNVTSPPIHRSSTHPDDDDDFADINSTRRPGDRHITITGGGHYEYQPSNLTVQHKSIWSKLCHWKQKTTPPPSNEQDNKYPPLPIQDDFYENNNNEVITSKYRIWNFLPINLMEQFSNVANMYFLFIGILQIIPQVSTTKGIPTIYQPLAFIVAVSALRAAREDYEKHRADAKRNEMKYQVLRNGELTPISSGSIRVGDIVQVRQDEMIPADMLFLASALPKGHCFIDKANLNGETTLEVCNSIVATRSIIHDIHSLSTLSLDLVYEPPNKHFESFRGTMLLDSRVDPHPTLVSLDGKSLLLRETNLRNCEYIYGLVVYNGNDTKIQRSNNEGEKVKLKRSHITRRINMYLKYMLVLQLTLCLIGAIIAGGAMTAGDVANMWFLQFGPSDTGALVGVLAFFSWFILLAQMVPISLIVSSEIVKFAQSRFIAADVTMYYDKINKPAKCNSSTIHEDLGLIDYIFSDKTGTLTQNKMEFRYMLLPLGEFGSQQTDIAKSVAARQNELEARRVATRSMAGEGNIPIVIDEQSTQQLIDADSPSSNSAAHGQVHPRSKLSWTQLTAGFYPPRTSRDRRQNCCDRYFPWFIKSCWRTTSLHDDEESGKEVEPAIDTGIPQGNVFTEQERQQLLLALWCTDHGYTSDDEKQSSSSSYETLQSQLRKYMTAMALSNTVKPYEDHGVLKFQAESAEELAMVTFAASCGFVKKSINPTILEIQTYHVKGGKLEKGQVETEKYNHLATLGFTSKRARVTVIYQRIESSSTNPIHVMIKGQDSVVLPLITLGNVGEENLLNSLQQMCVCGLRTLVCGGAELPLTWWSQRQAKYLEVISRDQTPHSEGHPAHCRRDLCEKCAAHEAFEQMEREANLTYAGCIGLEDQLQLLVPEAIADFLNAGIKVWMITGDKLETAKNIGLACNLIDPDMQARINETASLDQTIHEFSHSRLIEVTGGWANFAQDSEEMGKLFDLVDTDRDGRVQRLELRIILEALMVSTSKLDEFLPAKTGGKDEGIDKQRFIELMRSIQLSTFEAVRYDVECGIRTYNAIEDHETYPISILIDRNAFSVMFPGKGKKKMDETKLQELEELRAQFFKLASVSKSLVFARAEPAMKKKMVTEIQARVPKAITLAIGDGANDTDMITAAHVGVGISGVEGTAATNSADYAIGTFRMLHTLLFVHGFWSYQRISQLVNFIFYKALLLALTTYYFGFFSAFSGQQFFNDPLYQMYNVLFTAFPVLAVALYNQTLPRHVLEDHVEAYRSSRHAYFNFPIFVSWLFRSLCHSALSFFFCYGAFGRAHNITSSDGRTDGLWFFSTLAFFCITLVPTFLITFIMDNITIIQFGTVIISLVFFFPATIVANVIYTKNPDLGGVVYVLLQSSVAWLVLIIVISICLLLEVTCRYFKRQIWPTTVQLLQEVPQLPSHQRSAAYHHISKRTRSHGPPQLHRRMTERRVPTLEMDTHRMSIPTSSHVSGLSSVRINDDQFKHLKSSVVRSMLHFRNLTGSQFSSAAQAQLQVHDTFAPDGKKSSQQPHQRTSSLSHSSPLFRPSQHAGRQPSFGSGTGMVASSPGAPAPSSGYHRMSVSTSSNENHSPANFHRQSSQ